MGVLLLSGICGAEPDTAAVYPNAIGWDDGLSYRRKVSKDYTVTFRLSGDASRRSVKQEHEHRQINTEVDSVRVTLDERRDTSLYLNAGLTAGVAREILKSRPMTVDLYLRAGYERSWSTRESASSTRNGSDGHILHTGFGFEPACRFFSRFSLSTRFGVRYDYIRDEREHRSSSAHESWVYRHEGNDEHHLHRLELVGLPFSLTMRLAMHFSF
jgi:hypothetical protein